LASAPVDSGWGPLPAPPGQSSIPLLGPCLQEGLVALQQRAGGSDLADVVEAGEHQPALQLPPLR